MVLVSDLVLYVIIIIKIILGNNIKIHHFKYVRYFTTVYCAGVAFLFCFYYFRDIDYSNTNNFLVYEYIFIVIFHLITHEEYVVNYFRSIVIPDKVMGFKDVPFIYNLIFLLFFLAAGAVRCFIAYLRWKSAFIYNIFLIVLATDLNHTTGLIVYSCLHPRMRFIRRTLDNNFISVNIVSKEQVNKNVRVVRKCLHYYHNLLDSAKLIDKEMQGLILLAFVCNFVCWVSKISTIVRTCIQGGDSQLLLIHVLETLLTVVLVTSPAFAAELICYEVDEIKATLVRQLVRCPDESLRFELETALQYVQFRPFRLIICGAVPVNINLPFVVCSLCITYVIVVMQFTHFSTFST